MIKPVHGDVKNIDVFPISSIYALDVFRSALFAVRSIIESTNARKSGMNMLRGRIDTNHFWR